MDVPPRSHLLLGVVAVLALALVGMRVARAPERPAPPAPAAPVRVQSTGARDGDRLTVHVAGAVRRPGVYRLPPGARVDDAVRRAGGPAPRADLSAVNLAAELEDGRQVLVPRRLAAAGVPAPTGGAGPGGATEGAPLNLNQATLEQLDALEGIGPATAQKILDRRAETGGFSDVEELGQIPGIGEKRLAALRARVTV